MAFAASWSQHLLIINQNKVARLKAWSKCTFCEVTTLSVSAFYVLQSFFCVCILALALCFSGYLWDHPVWDVSVRNGLCVNVVLSQSCAYKSLFFPPTRSRQSLKVREHSVYGPYVDGLSKLAVASYKVRINFMKGLSSHPKHQVLSLKLDRTPKMLLISNLRARELQIVVMWSLGRTGLRAETPFILCCSVILEVSQLLNGTDFLSALRWVQTVMRKCSVINYRPRIKQSQALSAPLCHFLPVMLYSVISLPSSTRWNYELMVVYQANTWEHHMKLACRTVNVCMCIHKMPCFLRSFNFLWWKWINMGWNLSG